MTMRSTSSRVTFSNGFTLPGYSDELPAGDYDVLVEEELVHGLSFEAWRRVSTHLIVHGRGSRAGQTEMRAITETDLTKALGPDRDTTDTDGDAALPRQEDQR